MIKTHKEKIQYPIYRTKRHMYCDECGELMVREPIILTSYPAQYRYYCPKCRHTQTSYDVLDNEVWDYQTIVKHEDKVR